MTMITPSYLGETIEYSSLHACRSTLEDPTRRYFSGWPLADWAGAELGNLALPVPADLADFSSAADGFAVVRPASVSGPLHDLLPAGVSHIGGGGAGTLAASLAARISLGSDFIPVLPGRFFRVCA